MTRGGDTPVILRLAAGEPKNPIEIPDAVGVLTGSFAYAQDDVVKKPGE